MGDRRSRAGELAGGGNPLGWFETFYQEAGDDLSKIPWADGRPNPLLFDTVDRLALSGGRALKVGCGLGEDAEALAERGFRTAAFDISERAVELCRSRFPDSPVEYRVENLLNLPAEWTGAFDLVVEVYTLQVLPESLRRLALPALARTLAPGGRLVVLCRAREPDEAIDGFPWPLTASELTPFTEELGLVCDSFEDLVDDEDPPVRRFRAVYRRA